LTPPPLQPIRSPRDAAFAVLLESGQLVQTVLDADRAAIAGKDTYDDEYFERFFSRVKPLLERRLAESITATASLVVGAWQAAGSPQLKIEMPHAIQKVRAPK
jgi:hypothetical protein